MYPGDRYKSRHTSHELGVLTAFGAEGTEALLAIFNEVDHHACRLASARLLSQRRCPAAVEPLAAFLRATIAAGPGNPALLLSSSESPEAAYIRTCRDLFAALETLAPERSIGILFANPAPHSPLDACSSASIAERSKVSAVHWEPWATTAVNRSPSTPRWSIHTAWGPLA